MKVTQGWMISLEDEVKKSSEVELHVAFYSEMENKDFVFDGVHYYPMSIRYGSTSFQRFLMRHNHNEAQDKVLLPQLMNVVRRVNPDIVHICGTESNFGIIANKIKDIPVVFSLQGLMSPIKEKLYSGLPFSYLCSKDSFRSRLMGNDTRAKLRKFQYESVRESAFLSNALYVIGRTEWDKSIALLFNPQVHYYIVNEILRPCFYERVWDKKSFSQPFIIVSTISPGVYKGYETLLHAAKLLKEYGGFNFVWKVIGLSDSDNYARLCEDFKKIKASECNVQLVGRKTAEEMVELFLDVDLFCHTGHIENSPNSVCEAMMVGMPVIASNVGGTGSILEHNKEGILVQDGDPYGLAGAILEMKNNYDKAKEMGKNARSRALKRHNTQMIGEALLSTYQQILNDYGKN